MRRSQYIQGRAGGAHKTRVEAPGKERMCDTRRAKWQGTLSRLCTPSVTPFHDIRVLSDAITVHALRSYIYSSAVHSMCPDPPADLSSAYLHLAFTRKTTKRRQLLPCRRQALRGWPSRLLPSCRGCCGAWPMAWVAARRRVQRCNPTQPVTVRMSCNGPWGGLCTRTTHSHTNPFRPLHG